MQDFLVNTVLNLNEKSENKVAQAAIKLLFYFNVLAISIYFSEKAGLAYNGTKVTLDSAIDFIFSFQILIPVFIYLFTLILLKATGNLVSGLVAQLCRWPMHHLYYDGRSLTFHLSKLQVLTKELNVGPNRNAYVKGLKKRKKAIKEGKYWLEYTFHFMFSLCLIYNIIIPQHFPAMYHGLINIGIFLWTVVMFCFHVSFSYMWFIAKETEKILKLVEVSAAQIKTKEN